MEKIIQYYGQEAKVGCDEKCNKAWGYTLRPQIHLDKNDPDDFVYLSDDELGEAPKKPYTSEGNDYKPQSKSEIPNKWCVRQCERCAISMPNESHLPLVLPDFSKRNYNYEHKNK